LIACQFKGRRFRVAAARMPVTDVPRTGEDKRAPPIEEIDERGGVLGEPDRLHHDAARAMPDAWARAGEGLHKENDQGLTDFRPWLNPTTFTPQRRQNKQCQTARKTTYVPIATLHA